MKKTLNYLTMFLVMFSLNRPKESSAQNANELRKGFLTEPVATTSQDYAVWFKTSPDTARKLTASRRLILGEYAKVNDGYGIPDPNGNTKITDIIATLPYRTVTKEEHDKMNFGRVITDLKGNFLRFETFPGTRRKYNPAELFVYRYDVKTNEDCFELSLSCGNTTPASRLPHPGAPVSSTQSNGTTAINYASPGTATSSATPVYSTGTTATTTPAINIYNTVNPTQSNGTDGYQLGWNQPAAAPVTTQCQQPIQCVPVSSMPGYQTVYRQQDNTGLYILGAAILAGVLYDIYLDSRGNQYRVPNNNYTSNSYYYNMVNSHNTTTNTNTTINSHNTNHFPGNNGGPTDPPIIHVPTGGPVDPPIDRHQQIAYNNANQWQGRNQLVQQPIQQFNSPQVSSFSGSGGNFRGGLGWNK